MKCQKCDKEAVIKGLCRNHYNQKRYWEDPEFRKKRREYAKDYWQKYRCRKLIQDPNYIKRRNIEYRKKNPNRFTYASAKHYFKKLSPEMRKKLLYELTTNIKKKG
jgi:hypothetical protein